MPNNIPALDQLFKTHTLMGLFQDLREPQNFWRQLGFQQTMLFDTEHVVFEKIFEDRKAAPFAPALSQGEGIYDRNSELKAFKPAYIKMEDSVSPGQFIRKQPGQLATLNMSSPAARKALAVADILRSHRNALSNRLELMAAEVLIDGIATFSGPQYPEKVIDFQRDPSLTITLSPTETWDNPGVDIIADLTRWVRLMSDTPHGGTVRNIVFGENAWDIFRSDPRIRETLSLDVRGSVGDFNTGITAGDDVVYMGSLGVGKFGFQADFWINRQKILVEDPATGLVETKELMDPNAIVMVASNYMGVEAFGLPYDNQVAAPTDVLVYSYETDNPRILNIVTQSSPILVPMFPNRSLKATVVNV